MSNRTIAFDNLPESENQIPSPVKGFRFHPNSEQNVGYYDTQGYSGGYGAAAVSGVEAGYFVGSFSVTEADNQRFSATSGYFTAGSSDSDTLLITGYRNGQEVRAREFSVSDTPTFLNLRGFQDVNKLTVSSVSGSEDAFDNLTLNHHS